MDEVYKFMAGIVDTITGGEEEDEYDPHKHRKVAHPTSYLDTMIHMLKGSIGAGILAMPAGVARVGIVVGTGGIALIGLFTFFAIQLLINVQYLLCKRWKVGYMAYPKSMRLALQEGPQCLRCSASFFYYFVDSVMVVWQLGLCVIYFIFVAENIKQVCDYYGWVVSLRFHICYSLIPELLLNMVKDLKMMTPMSTISNIVTVFSLILLSFYLMEDDLEVQTDMLYIKDLEGIPVFIGITLFAMEAVGVILALEYNMEQPERFLGTCGVLNIGIIVITSLYALVGLFGYLKYNEAIKASITLNLPATQKKAQATNIMFSLAIALSFPLQNFVAYNIIWRKIQKKFGTDTATKCVDYSLRVGLVLIPWLVALAVPQLGPFISLIGAFCLSLLAAIFPGIMDLCYWHKEPERYGLCKYRLVRDIFIILVGILALISGCYTSILEILHDMVEKGNTYSESVE